MVTKQTGPEVAATAVAADSQGDLRCRLCHDQEAARAERYLRKGGAQLADLAERLQLPPRTIADHRAGHVDGEIETDRRKREDQVEEIDRARLEQERIALDDPSRHRELSQKVRSLEDEILLLDHRDAERDRRAIAEERAEWEAENQTLETNAREIEEKLAAARLELVDQTTGVLRTKVASITRLASELETYQRELEKRGVGKPAVRADAELLQLGAFLLAELRDASGSRFIPWVASEFRTGEYFQLAEASRKAEERS